MFEKVNGAIVKVYLRPILNGEKLAQGSGVIVKDKGYLLTNFHVFAGGEKMVLVHNEDTIRYTEIIGVHVERDIIILKLEGTDFPKHTISATVTILK